jgi:hypothetical protein
MLKLCTIHLIYDRGCFEALLIEHTCRTLGVNYQYNYSPRCSEQETKMLEFGTLALKRWDLTMVRVCLPESEGQFHSTG